MVEETDILRILITGAGAPGIRGTVHALRHNPDNQAVHLTGVDIRPDAVGRHILDDFVTVPNPEDKAYVERLLQICREREIELIIPQTTREIEVLAEWRKTFVEAGIAVMVSHKNAISIANDKAKLLDAFVRLGLPVPVYYLVQDQESLVTAAKSLGYPDNAVVVKPAHGNGMRGVRILTEERWDVQRFLSEKPSGLEMTLDGLCEILRKGDSWPRLLVTEYLPGAEYTVDVFRGESYAVAIPRKRATVRSGITFDAVLEFNEEIIAQTMVVSEALDLRYAFGFQYKLDQAGNPKVLECNPRVQGTMVASLLSGVNVIWLGVLELLGKKPNGVISVKYEGKFQRYWGGIGISGGEMFEI